MKPPVGTVLDQREVTASQSVVLVVLPPIRQGESRHGCPPQSHRRHSASAGQVDWAAAESRVRRATTRRSADAGRRRRSVRAPCPCRLGGPGLASAWVRARWMNGLTRTVTSWQRSGAQGSGSRRSTHHRAVLCSELAVRVPAGVLSTRGRWTWRCSASTWRPRSRSSRASSSVRPAALFRTTGIPGVMSHTEQLLDGERFPPEHVGTGGNS